MNKLLVLTVSLAVLVVVTFLTIISNAHLPKGVKKSEIDIAANQARFIYNSRKMNGENFSDSPCLSNALLPGWVLDIAHNPRQSIDDLSQNQCPAYLEGRAQHFVELDPEGNLIRAQ